MVEKDKTPVAQDVLTYCTRCKMMLNHIVVSQLDGYVAKVKCLTCGSNHNYKSEKNLISQSSKKRKSSTAPKASRSKHIALYFSLIETYKDNPAKQYSMSSEYELNDIIEHPSFEKGIVTKLLRNKMEVLFHSGPKTLVCNKI